MEIPRDARGADLIKSRYVAPQPLAPACSDGYSRIDLVEKAHLHVRFVFSKSETQKRPQRASHNAQLRSPRRAWEMEALCRRSSPKTVTPCTSRSEPRLLATRFLETDPERLRCGCSDCRAVVEAAAASATAASAEAAAGETAEGRGHQAAAGGAA